eukprot:gnl/TRDRNA2_/TRDRNA2_132776_c3_seq2.p1 gnl/TRDRNA2_/TRDRNA2_132776_c3~~gnl/TRDRNA2_/TRDRNA2_132776_c3_seq2.p1  ORF type:complete len:234 (+),score=49.10 gnl/TRDRNA2_/TRDRNA2_132776_c3_seq2:51-752(+)
MGHEWFDLGQAKRYKTKLGSQTLQPAAWLERFKKVRDKQCFPFQHEPIGGEALMRYLLHAMEDAGKLKTTDSAELPQPDASSGSVMAASSHVEAPVNWTWGEEAPSEDISSREVIASEEATASVEDFPSEPIGDPSILKTCARAGIVPLPHATDSDIALALVSAGAPVVDSKMDKSGAITVTASDGAPVARIETTAEVDAASVAEAKPGVDGGSATQDAKDNGLFDFDLLEDT